MRRLLARTGLAVTMSLGAFGAQAQSDPHAGHHGHHGHHGGAAAPAAAPAQPPPAPPPQGEVDHAADLYFDPARMARARAQLRAENGDIRLGAVFIDRLEAAFGEGETELAFEAQAWRGGDINRLWLKLEGEGAAGGRLEAAQAQLLYSRAVSPFWNLQAGVRQDLNRHGADPGHLVLGAHGLAPHWWEVDGALFLSTDGELTAKAEAEYDQRLTQRLILQPRLEVTLAAEDAPTQGLGAGLTTWSAGMRLRYELAREFAPYVGVSWSGAAGDTAKLRRSQGEETQETRLLLGVRTWF